VLAPLFGRLPRNLPFWCAGCAQLAPGLALDIGLNFGECLFSGDYSPGTELHGFEANPRLRPYVQRSVREHPARRQMTLHFALVTTAPGPDAEFFIDRRWSGGSTAVAGLHAEEADRYEAIRVPVTSIDARLAKSHSNRPGRTLFFKIDVEGYEYQVLQGMQRTLESPPWAIGLVEFDTQLLQRAGTSLPEYWRFLQSRFQVYAFVRGGAARPVAAWSDLTQLFRRSEFHTDLLLVRGDVDESVERFLGSWCTTPPVRERAARAA
jgi:FkbM family methyltransferase